MLSQTRGTSVLSLFSMLVLASLGHMHPALAGVYSSAVEQRALLEEVFGEANTTSLYGLNAPRFAGARQQALVLAQRVKTEGLPVQEARDELYAALVNMDKPAARATASMHELEIVGVMPRGGSFVTPLEDEAPAMADDRVTKPEEEVSAVSKPEADAFEPAKAEALDNAPQSADENDRQVSSAEATTPDAAPAEAPSAADPVLE